jgi:Fe-S oxidoreductase
MPTGFRKPRKVYFFGTCVIDAVYPQTGLAAIQLLEREGNCEYSTEITLLWCLRVLAPV